MSRCSVAIPDVVSKLDSLDDSTSIRVTTSEGHEIEGTVDDLRHTVDDEDPRNRDVFVLVATDGDTVLDLGSIWCDLRISATRRRDGWSDVEASIETETGEKSLGVVETVERIE